MLWFAASGGRVELRRLAASVGFGVATVALRQQGGQTTRTEQAILEMQASASLIV
jgi:hypothetical protein